MIQVESLNKSYFIHQKDPGLKGSIQAFFQRKKIEKKALQNINFNINEGEIVGLIGENGAGKTTLAKILSGIIYPTSGKVRVLGHEPQKRQNPYLRKMSLIMGQKAQLWWDLPALDSFLLLKEIYQIEDKLYQKKIHELSEILNVQHLLKTQIRRLSLGERMKVEIMASLLHDPKVVFLDEPTIGLDLNAQKAVREFIKGYRQEYSPIMILTSHYMDDIDELCDRIIILQKGKIIYDGPKENIYSRYQNHEVLKIQYSTDQEFLKATKDQSLSQHHCSQNQDSFRINYRVTTEDKNQLINHLLNNYQIQDISISKTELGDIISQIMANQL